MKKSAMWKDIFREIWKSKARFLSIFAIILLGVAFFAGLVATGPVMTETSNRYFDEKNLMDLQVLSSYGLADEDMDILNNLEDAAVEGRYMADVILDETDHTTKLYGYNEEQVLNQYVLIEGRLPEDTGEIALDASPTFVESYDIGDTVSINENTNDSFDENFSELNFEVVGFVQTPQYIMDDGGRGNTTIGGGTVDGFGVIMEEDFDLEYLTEASIHFEDSADMDIYSDEYAEFITAKAAELEEVFEKRSKERYEEIKQETQNEIDQARQEIADARKELDNAEQELLEAGEELERGREELEQGQQELNEQRQAAEEEFQERRQQIEEGRRELNQAEEELNNAQNQLDAGQVQLEQMVYQIGLPAVESQIQAGQLEIAAGREELTQAQAEIDQGRSELESREAALKSELADRRQQTEAGQAALEDARSQLDAGQDALNEAQTQLDTVKEEVEAGADITELIGRARREFTDRQAEVDKGFRELQEQENLLETAETDLTTQLSEVESELSELKEKVEEIQKEAAVNTTQLSTMQLSSEPNEELGRSEEEALNGPNDEIEVPKEEKNAGETGDSEAPGDSEEESEETPDEPDRGTETPGEEPGQEETPKEPDSETEIPEEGKEENGSEEEPKESEGETEVPEEDPENEGQPADSPGEADTPPEEQPEEESEEQPEGSDVPDQSAEAGETEETPEETPDESEQETVPLEIIERMTELEGMAQSLGEELFGIQSQRERLETARQELEVGQEELDQARAEFLAWAESLTAAEPEAALAAAQAELDRRQDQLTQAYEELGARSRQLTQAESLIAEGEAAVQTEFQSARAALNQAQAQVDRGWEELRQGEAELSAGLAQLQAGNREIAAAREELTVNQARIDEGRAALAEGFADIAAGEGALNAAETEALNQLNAAQAEIDSAREELEQGEAEYEEGLTEFEEEAASAEEEIAEGEEELDQAEEDLGNLEEPEYFVNDHTDLSGISEFGENADRIAAIATIFPVFFFLLAVLISLTTMTRMVDEGRNQIGTMKALGYQNGAISTKYFVYAFTASIAGGIIGLFIGYWLFPNVIMNAYSTMYNLPSADTRWFWDIALISMIGALAATGLATYFSIRSLLKNNAADLLRPKAPKKGKRILLERIPFIWEKMSFTQKVSARNLFRYKGRMFMTVFGVAGGTALLLTGFGLSDSISNINPIQFGELHHYDATVALEPEAESPQIEELDQTLEENDLVGRQLGIYQANGTAFTEEDQLDFSLMVPSDEEIFYDLITLRDYEDEEYIHELTENGAIVTEKLADTMDTEPGGTITISDDSENDYVIPVAGVVEHYAGHFIYMSEEAYTGFMEDSLEDNSLLLQYSDPDYSEEEEEALNDTLAGKEAAVGVFFQSDVIESFQDSMDSLGVVTIVLIVSAGALAFVVLYNLTNINVSERVRELSTIKVLGFYDSEVTKYIYRENIILTIMGILAGYGLGIIMHRFILNTAEIDILRFVRTIEFSSYIYSALLMLLFSIIVGIVMHFKLKGIDMVEALKSED